MPASKSERLVNLVICLLASKQYVTKEKLRSTIEPYRNCVSDEAFERMFERDKDDLREMGIPLETGATSAVFDDEIGYRISPGEYALPELRLEPDEAAALGLAARFWQQATMAGAASSALLKLKAAGIEVGDVSPAGIEPRVRAGAPAFEPLLQAICDRQAVTFPYRKSDEAVSRQRTIEPWAIDSWHGRWYLAGFDRDRDDVRVFRLDRITGQVRPVGALGVATADAEFDVRAKVESYARGARENGVAQLRIRIGAGFPLRRRASSTEASDIDGWDLVKIPSYDGIEGYLAEFAADVVVLDPPELRDAVIDRLRAVAGLQPAQRDVEVAR